MAYFGVGGRLCDACHAFEAAKRRGYFAVVAYFGVPMGRRLCDACHAFEAAMRRG